MSITELSIKRPLLIIVVFVVLILFGVLSYFSLNYELLPKFDAGIITVRTTYAGASPQDIESNITKPIEDAVSTVEGIDNITSRSMSDVSVITIRLKPNIKDLTAQTDIERKISQIKSVLPKDADAIANAVLRIMNEPKLVSDMVREARKRVEVKYTLRQMAEKTIQVYEELRRSTNILVIKLSAVGDIILVAASFKALRQRFPGARICCLVGREGLSLLQGCPYLDDIIVYDYKEKHKGVFGFWQVLKKLRHYRFDKIIDFQNNNRSHLLTFLCLPRASYGYKNGKSGLLLTDGIKDDEPDLPPVKHQFRVLEKLGIRYEDSVRLEFWPRKDDFEYARELLHSEWIDEKAHALVGINIAASERWATKNWPTAHLAKLCDMLTAEGVRVVITGMEKDREFVKQLSMSAKSKPAILVGKTNILQLASLMSFFRCYVTPDSAPLHVAAAMDVPVVALFGPTKPERHVPPAKKLTVIRKSIDCSGCYKAQCHRHKLSCMNGISPEEVFTEVMRYVNT